MLGNMFGSGNTGAPWPFAGIGDADGSGDLKSRHDTYDVYVNDDFVGRKVLLNPSDKVDDVASFLHSRGVQDFSYEVSGDHFVIGTEDERADNVKRQLEVYLNIR